MPHLLYLWRDEGESSPVAIQRQLDADEDVPGLTDLPIREMLDRLKQEFPGAKESAGELVWRSGDERFRATWTWQFMRLESDQLSDEHRDKFYDLARSFGCPVFDPQLGLRTD